LAKKKAFFSEKQKKKDYIEPNGAEEETLGRLARTPKEKSFVLLFFKKEESLLFRRTTWVDTHATT
jgi:hypothetical protein